MERCCSTGKASVRRGTSASSCCSLVDKKACCATKKQRSTTKACGTAVSMKGQRHGCANSCCTRAKPQTCGANAASVRAIDSGSKASRSLPKPKTCCDKAPGANPSGFDGKSKTKDRCGQVKVDCCGSSVAARTNNQSCSEGCCGQRKAKTRDDDGCCNGHSDDLIVSAEEVKATVEPVDPENGLSGSEHVVLGISGMTCTGCETKLKRTLASLSSIKNLKTSLVLARVEFDLDLAVNSTEKVIKHLERTTEFKCEKISTEGFSLDLVSSEAPAADVVSTLWRDGVTDVAALDTQTIRVTFDTSVIGARTLFETEWASCHPMELAPPRPDPILEAGSKHVCHMGYMTMLSGILTIPVLVMAWAPLPENELAYAWASLVLASIVQVVIAGPFYPKALKSLVFSRVIEMDLLIVLSTSAAYVFSVVSFGHLAVGNPLSTGQFFETSTLLVTLVMVGRYVAALARQKAVESISIRSLQTSTALLVGEDGAEREIDTRLLQYGDIFKVGPETRIPTDGEVISGSSEVDESMITGESRPVEKYVKSKVIAGSINGSGILAVRLSRLPGDNTISTIANMVDEAKIGKPKIQSSADLIAGYVVPVVVFLALITFLVWVSVGMGVRRQSMSEATVQAITYAITVLIVSCPCAIGLAVPMVVVIASGAAAERGIIFKSADSIECASKTSHVVFDKTGTLTLGKLAVVREEYWAGDISSAKSMLLGLVGSIKHPVSVAVTTHLRAQGASASSIKNAKTLTGKGVEGATASGVLLRAGNSRWLGLSSDPRVQSALSGDYTVFAFTINESLAAVFTLRDSPRPDAASTIARLRDSGISVHVISGDDHGAVRSVARDLAIPEANIRSRCTPGDKQSYIKDLLSPQPSSHQRRGCRLRSVGRYDERKSRVPVVVFCGDGTNDAVALAQATIGVHMNEGGTEIARSAADVVLMRPNLGGILSAISVSKKAMHRIMFNFTWSFVYNFFAILLAAGAFVTLNDVRIPPELAGLGELVSVLPVIVAAVLLRWAKID